MSQFTDLLETWSINHRITLYILEAINDPLALESRPFGLSGWSVKLMFAQIHNLRMMWLQPIDADFAQSVSKIPTRGNTNQRAITKDTLFTALTQSGEILGNAIGKRLESGNTDIFQPSPTAFIGYLISHESFYRGQICLTLQQAGYALPDEVQYGMWIWDKR